jgi:large subunit ribosomal protein L21
MYSIVTISGKQYCVSEGDIIKVSSQDWKVGDRVKLDQVLLTNNGKIIEVGTPKVKGAYVTVEILEHNRDKKLLIYKKKRRKGYQRKNGHRQGYTLLKINNLKMASTKKIQKNNSFKDSEKSFPKKKETE